MEIREVRCKSILSKSGLYGVDYSINPYTGCQHGCRYCYAVYMKKYTDHGEPWGEFVDVKINAPEKMKEDLIKAEPGSVLLSSVTDPYQPLEKKYRITRKILQVLAKTGFSVTILTKNDLVLRDMDVLKKFDHGNISVGFTINFLSEKDRKIWEPLAPPIDDRIEALQELSSEGVPTYVHVGPYFEGITDLEEILEWTEDLIAELQVENLNWTRRKEVLRCVKQNYPELEERYREISRSQEGYKNHLKEKVRSLRRKTEIPVRLFLD